MNIGPPVPGRRKVNPSATVRFGFNARVTRATKSPVTSAKPSPVTARLNLWMVSTGRSNIARCIGNVYAVINAPCVPAYPVRPLPEKVKKEKDREKEKRKRGGREVERE